MHTHIHTCTRALIAVQIFLWYSLIHYSHWSGIDQIISECRLSVWLGEFGWSLSLSLRDRFSIRLYTSNKKRHEYIDYTGKPHDHNQCVLCPCSRLCGSIWVCFPFSSAEMWNHHDIVSVTCTVSESWKREGGCQLIGNSPSTHTVYQYRGLSLRLILSFRATSYPTNKLGLILQPYPVGHIQTLVCCVRKQYNSYFYHL